jgi:hypothetical protein
MWLRPILRPQNPRLLCVRLRSRVASEGVWPWKWPKPELAGHECGGGVVEADRGPGVVGDGALYGLDGAVDGKAGVEATTGGA